MGLFILQEDQAILESISLDITNSLIESKSNLMGEEIEKQKIIQMVNAGIKANGDMSKLTKINGAIEHIEDLSWLEKKQLQIEAKIKEYTQKLKSKESGALSRVWTKVKQFLLKIVGFIVKTINKLHRSAKTIYRASSALHDNHTTTDIDDIAEMSDQIKDRRIRYKIASRAGAISRSSKNYGSDDMNRLVSRYTKRAIKHR